jgi:hypothetical protein
MTRAVGGGVNGLFKLRIFFVLVFVCFTGGRCDGEPLLGRERGEGGGGSTSVKPQLRQLVFAFYDAALPVASCVAFRRLRVGGHRRGEFARLHGWLHVRRQHAWLELLQCS